MASKINIWALGPWPAWYQCPQHVREAVKRISEGVSIGGLPESVVLHGPPHHTRPMTKWRKRLALYEMRRRERLDNE